MTLPATADRALVATAVASTAAALGATIAVVFVKYASPIRLRRRAIEPVLLAVTVVLGSYVAQTVVWELGGDTSPVTRALTAAGALAIPFAVVGGQARARLYAASSIGSLVLRHGSFRGRVTAREIEEFLAHALGDGTLRLYRWSAESGGYVDVDGITASPPTASRERSTTSVTDGGPVAVVAHDPVLDDSAGIVRGLTTAAVLLLENTRLVDDLRVSRKRIVATRDGERLRLERNLHDGAQQRLLLLQIKLAELQRTTPDVETAAALRVAVGDTAIALEELRALAHGLYPPTLAERGVADALRSIGAGTGARVEVFDSGLGRCPPTVEAAVYFAALEAVHNAAKHAGPNARVRVSLARRAGAAEFVVDDDGAGFDVGRARRGVGLASMYDRIGAAGGELAIVSTPGGGTVVRGTVPLDAEP